MLKKQKNISIDWSGDCNHSQTTFSTPWLKKNGSSSKIFQKAFIMVAACNSAISSTMEAVRTIDSLHDLNEQNLPSPDCQNVLELALLCLKDLGADHPTGWSIHDALKSDMINDQIWFKYDLFVGCCTPSYDEDKPTQAAEKWLLKTHNLRLKRWNGGCSPYLTLGTSPNVCFQCAFSQILKP